MRALSPLPPLVKRPSHAAKMPRDQSTQTIDSPPDCDGQFGTFK
jgi:hypothetical protein